MAGLARAKAEGIQLGRPAEIAGDVAKVKAMKAARAAGKSVRQVASRVRDWRRHSAETDRLMPLPRA